MLRWSINLGRIFGIQLLVHFSFVLVVAYAAWLGWDLHGGTGAGWSVAMLLVFFGCVILHELGHSLTARRFGVHVPRIRILPIGGMAEFDSIPRNPRQEILITIAGPAVNFVIAAALWPFVTLPENWDAPAVMFSPGGLLRQMFVANLVMGLFNLIPAFPMDGGRILRAVLAVRLPYLRATFWAATVGKVLAGAGILAAYHFDQLMLMVLFAFIFVVGELEYRAAIRREREEAHWREFSLRQYGLTRPSQPSLLN